MEIRIISRNYCGFDAIINKGTFEGITNASIDIGVEEDALHVITLKLGLGSIHCKYIFRCFDHYEQLNNQLSHMLNAYSDYVAPDIELPDPVETLELQGFVRSIYKETISYTEDEQVIEIIIY